MDFISAVRQFRRRFPDGGLNRCDFRPQFDGFLVNAHSAMFPRGDASATRVAALKLLAEIAHWLKAHSDAFNVGDQLQLIVGFPESVKPSCRQIFKCWLPAAMLGQLNDLDFSGVGGGFREFEVWPLGVEWSNVASTNGVQTTTSGPDRAD